MNHGEETGVIFLVKNRFPAEKTAPGMCQTLRFPEEIIQQIEKGLQGLSR